MTNLLLTLWRVGVFVLLTLTIYLLYDLSLKWNADNQTQFNLRERISELESENRSLYGELDKVVGEREALSEELYKLKTAARLDLQHRTF